MGKGKENEDQGQFEAVYQQFTLNIVQKWEAAVQTDPGAQWNENNIGALLPFVKRVMPRIGRNQSLFGLSIISLEGKLADETAIVDYGLEPLIQAEVLSDEEAAEISSWFQQTKPTWDSGTTRRFEKEFEIEGTRYRLITDSYRNCRDLNLQVI